MCLSVRPTTNEFGDRNTALKRLSIRLRRQRSHFSASQLKSLIPISALLLNFSRLPPTSPWLLPLARQSSVYAKAPSSLWYEFSPTHFQSFLIFAFLNFDLEDIYHLSSIISIRFGRHKIGKPVDSPAYFRPFFFFTTSPSKFFTRIILSPLHFFLESITPISYPPG